jgi:hypothetical protein
MCSWCAALHTEKTLSLCTACHLASYCSRECQKQHRPVHKKLCARVRDRVAEDGTLVPTKAHRGGGDTAMATPAGWARSCILSATIAMAECLAELSFRRRCAVCCIPFDALDQDAAASSSSSSTTSAATGPLAACGDCGLSFACERCRPRWTAAHHGSRACAAYSVLRAYQAMVAVDHEHPAVVNPGRTRGVDLAAVAATHAAPVVAGGTAKSDPLRGGNGNGGGNGGGATTATTTTTTTGDLKDAGDGGEKNDDDDGTAEGSRIVIPYPLNAVLWDAYFGTAVRDDLDPTMGAPEARLLRVIASVRLAVPVTIVHAAQAGELGRELCAILSARDGEPVPASGGPYDDLVIHVVGASMQLEAGKVGMWEEITHLCPAVRRLSVVLVGPKLRDSGPTDDERDDHLGPDGCVPGFDSEMCASCTDEPGVALHIELYRQAYHAYARSSKYTAPHLVVMCNSGAGSEADDLWTPTLEAIAETGAPILLTAPHLGEAAAARRFVEQCAARAGQNMTLADARKITGPRVNPFRQVPAFPTNVLTDDAGDIEAFTVPGAYVVAVGPAGEGV